MNSDTLPQLTPLQILKDILRIDSGVAKVIYVGMAVIAAAAIVISWKVDIESAVRIGVYILGLAFFALVITFVAASRALALFLGWAFAVILISSASALLVSAVFEPPGMKPPYCLVQFWLPCSAPGGAADQFAERNFTPVTQVQSDVPAPPPNEVKPADYRVSVQFAGVIRREDVRTMMQKLQNIGWRVQGVSGGGERTTDAIGYNEIRYASQDDERAAQRLAADVQAANLVSKPIRLQKVDRIPAKSLEVWVSRT